LGDILAETLERAFWNAYARSYDNLARHHQPYKDLVNEVCDCVDRFAQGRSLRVLDAGCGTGNFSWELTRRGHQVKGFDSSAAMLKRAETKRLSQPEHPDFRQLDLSQPLPYADGDFDAAVSVSVLFALADTRAALSNIRRTVRDGGLLVVTAVAERPAVSAVFREAVRREGLLRGIRTLLPLASVGVFSWLIDRRLASRNTTYEEQDLRADLAASGWLAKRLSRTYTDQSDLLAEALAEPRNAPPADT